MEEQGDVSEPRFMNRTKAIIIGVVLVVIAISVVLIAVLAVSAGASNDDGSGDTFPEQSLSKTGAVISPSTTGDETTATKLTTTGEVFKTTSSDASSSAATTASLSSETSSAATSSITTTDVQTTGIATTGVATTGIATTGVQGPKYCGPNYKNPVCGNGFCEETEMYWNCPADCPGTFNCGNGICDTAESYSLCPEDCRKNVPICGDGTCSGGVEDKYHCPHDCGEPFTCGNSICESTEGESCGNCPSDCGGCAPLCGDEICHTDSGETCQTCARDCGICPASANDGKCQYPYEDCSNSPGDCGACPPSIVNSVEFRGRWFATVDDRAHNDLSNFGCQTEYKAIPAGWRLAPFDSDVYDMFATPYGDDRPTGAYTWGTGCVALEDQSLINVLTGQPCATTSMPIGFQGEKVAIRNTSFCDARILLVKGSFSSSDCYLSCSNHGVCNPGTGRCHCTDKWTGYGCERAIGDISVPQTGATWWKPPLRASWNWQLQLEIDTSKDVEIFDIDADVPAHVIAELHAKGKKVICYISGGSWEAWRADQALFPREILGGPLIFGVGDVFYDEAWVDVRRPEIILPIMINRIGMMAHKKCDAVEWDNPDSFYHESGFKEASGGAIVDPTYNDQLRFNRLMGEHTHAHGMAVISKNNLYQARDLFCLYDGVVNEQCWEDEECQSFWPYVTAGKPLFQVEYNTERCSFCDRANLMQVNSLRKNPALDPCYYDCLGTWPAICESGESSGECPNP